MKNQYICLHITKTAGGTLKRSLQAADNLSVEFIYNRFDKEALVEKGIGDTDLLYGHTLFGIHEELGYAKTPRYMCFMRHPLTRTISHYHHLYNVDKSAVGDKIRKSKDINDFFENYSHWEFSNFMTRVISGAGRAEGADEDEILEQAKKTLDEHFEFVGFQEYFMLSVRQLETVVDRKLTFEKDINVGRYDMTGISAATLNRIEQATKQDVALYKYALERYLK